MNFKYYRSTKEEFTSSCIWSSLIFFGLITLFIYVFIRTENKIVLFFVLPIIIAALFNLFRVWKLSKATGRWEIYITDTEIVWQTPKGFESGFVILISEISKYIEASSSLNEYTSHYLELKNGTKLHLNPNVSNFNFTSFSKALIKLGIKHEVIIES